MSRHLSANFSMETKRHMLVMRHLNDTSPYDIAQFYGCSVEAVHEVLEEYKEDKLEYQTC